MTQTSSGTRDEPQFASAGNSPTFAADLSLLATFAAARSFRSKTTVALLAAATGSSAGEWGKADAAPGALYFYNATTGTWQLGNQPTVADQSHRDALFSGTLVPVQGDEVFRTDLGRMEVYFALYNASTNPGGASVAGWYPGDNNGPSCVVQRNATVQNLGATAYTILSGVFADVEVRGGVTSPTANSGKMVAPIDGWYHVDIHAYMTTASAMTALLVVKKNSVTTDAAGVVLRTTSGGLANVCDATVSGDVLMAAGDYLSVGIDPSAAAVLYTAGTPSTDLVWSMRFVRPARH